MYVYSETFFSIAIAHFSLSLHLIGSVEIVLVWYIPICAYGLDDRCHVAD